MFETFGCLYTDCRELDFVKDFQKYLDFIRMEVFSSTRPFSTRKYIVCSSLLVFLESVCNTVNEVNLPLQGKTYL